MNLINLLHNTVTTNQSLFKNYTLNDVQRYRVIILVEIYIRMLYTKTYQMACVYMFLYTSASAASHTISHYSSHYLYRQNNFHSVGKTSFSSLHR